MSRALSTKFATLEVKALTDCLLLRRVHESVRRTERLAGAVAGAFCGVCLSRGEAGGGVVEPAVELERDEEGCGVLGSDSTSPRAEYGPKLVPPQK